MWLHVCPCCCLIVGSSFNQSLEYLSGIQATTLDLTLVFTSGPRGFSFLSWRLMFIEKKNCVFFLPFFFYLVTTKTTENVVDKMHKKNMSIRKAGHTVGFFSCFCSLKRCHLPTLQWTQPSRSPTVVQPCFFSTSGSLCRILFLSQDRQQTRSLFFLPVIDEKQKSTISNTFILTIQKKHVKHHLLSVKISLHSSSHLLFLQFFSSISYFVLIFLHVNLTCQAFD